MDNSSSSGSIQAPPKTLLQLLWIIIKNFPKSFLSGLKRNLIFSGSIALAVWLVHTYLMVGPNGGFAPSNPSFNNILALRGRVVSGTLFWTMLSGVIFTSYSIIKSTSIPDYFSSIKNAIVKFFQSIIPLLNKSVLGMPMLTFFVAGSAIGTALALYLKNSLIYMLIILTIFISLGQGGKSFWLIVVRLTLSDIKSLFKLKNEIDINIIYMVTYGFITGLVIAIILAKSTFFMWIITLLLIGFLVFNITRKTGNSTLSLFLMVFSGTLFFYYMKAHADDGGWQEAGGTFERWVKSQGAAQAVSMGIPPAVGSGIAASVVTTMQGVVSDTTTSVNESIGTDVGDFVPDKSIFNKDTFKNIGLEINNRTKDNNTPNIKVPDTNNSNTEMSSQGSGNIETPDSGKTEIDLQIERELRERDEYLRKQREEAAEYERERQERIRQKAEREKELLEKARIEREKQMKREELRRQHEQNVKEMEEANRSAWWWEKITGAAEVVKKGCDVSIDLLSNVTGKPGKIIKSAYTVASKMGEGVGDYMVDGKDLGQKLGEKFADGASGVVEDYVGGKYGDKAKAMVTVSKNVIKKTYNDGLSVENVGKGMLEGVKEVTVDQVAGKICDKVPGLKEQKISVDYQNMGAKDLISSALKKDESLKKSLQNTIRGEIGNQAKNTDNQQAVIDYALKKPGYKT